MIDEIRWVSSLEKVFPETEPAGSEGDEPLSFFQNESFSLQCAFHTLPYAVGECEVTLAGELAPYARVREVCLMPSRFPGRRRDDLAEPQPSYRPGLYPDLLRELPKERTVRLYPGQWQSLFVTIELPKKLSADIDADKEAGAIQEPDVVQAAEAAQAEPHLYELEITLRQGDAWQIKKSCRVEVLPEELPPQKLIHTEWFHTDCLADYYRVPVWSEEHWRIIKNFMEHYAKMGMNMILIPAFTPPLDTAVGGERTTVQLVDVSREQGQWRFGFDRLYRFLQMADAAGIRYFEFAQLFTQWGAKAAPKIVGESDGCPVRFFGWETDSQGEEYLGFLENYLRALTAQLIVWGYQDRAYFHLSDEPEGDALEIYTALKKRLKPVLGQYPILDALSDDRFYQQGGVDIPVAGMERIDRFLEIKASPLFAYYCGCHVDGVPNRLFAMPSARNRILGVLLYIYRIQGFLHWGYNFYNAQFSTRHLNPYAETDAGGGFASGDSFLVYPGEDGQPEDSIRMQVMLEAMQDLRALELGESLLGREKVLALICELAGELPKIKKYPQDAAFLIELRKKLNKMIHDMTGYGSRARE